MAESLVAAFGDLENRRRSDVSTVEIETVSAGAMKDIIAVDDGATVEIWSLKTRAGDFA